MNRNVVHNEKRQFIATQIRRQEYGTIADYLRKKQPSFYFKNCRAEGHQVLRAPILKYSAARKNLTEDPRYKQMFDLKSRNADRKTFWQNVLESKERQISFRESNEPIYRQKSNSNYSN